MDPPSYLNQTTLEERKVIYNRLTCNTYSLRVGHCQILLISVFSLHRTVQRTHQTETVTTGWSLEKQKKNY